MSWVLVVDGIIRSEGRLPYRAVRLLDSGEWIDLSCDDPETAADAGYFKVVDTARPADTATTTWVRTVELVDAVPTETWTEVALSQAQIDAATQQANVAALTADAASNIDTLLATVTALNTLTARTNADINSNPAAAIKDVAREVKTVARQTVRLARLLTGSTTSTDTGS